MIEDNGEFFSKPKGQCKEYVITIVVGAVALSEGFNNPERVRQAGPFSYPYNAKTGLERARFLL